MKNIGIVILNYIEYSVTIDCVNSFKEQTAENLKLQFIIVDNDSPNESFDVLSEKYKNDNNIVVVKTPSNLGFANGNNFGYFELVKYMTPDFVIFSNSDIILPQDGLYEWILKCDTQYNFGVLGPSIYSTNANFYQNPVRNLTTDIKELRHLRRELLISLVKIRIKMIFNLDKLGTHLEQWTNSDYNKFHDDLTLHGAFQIMSKEYFKFYRNAYDSGTFLYLEEDILRLRCNKSKLRMVYSPEFTVSHLQSFSTNADVGSLNRKSYNRVKNMLNSLRRYKKLLEEE